MRLAVVSDIHGNLPALDAVLAEIGALGVDRIVNLGDVASGPLWPRETIERLMPLALPTLAGNHERQLLALGTAVDPRDRGSDALAARALGEPERAWLRTLPKSLRLAGGVAACHGTPSSDCRYLMETVTDDFGRAGSLGLRAATEAELLERLDGAEPAAVLLCGHSHLPRVRRLGDGRLLVNPGSVGLPAYDDERPHRHHVENGDAAARWALLESAGAGWRAELRATAYDAEAAARRAEAQGRGDWADALRSGRVGRTEAAVLGRVA
ncbi:MAG TPA: metallophosphoesterase family protein [Methylibium sp.]|uniref:metallophosphoesterase family protein n=1 Tax=Methylibium sp. TaxID=2067992 RepID=UPI002DBA9B47|nr:metallophosphoesterase family protein [Methylibium sp.]HEU4460500.1 metallophosphoesterase family protein [Methylibium sp.]